MFQKKTEDFFLVFLSKNSKISCFTCSSPISGHMRVQMGDRSHRVATWQLGKVSLMPRIAATSRISTKHGLLPPLARVQGAPPPRAPHATGTPRSPPRRHPAHSSTHKASSLRIAGAWGCQMRCAFALLMRLDADPASTTSSRQRPAQHRGSDQPCFLSQICSKRISHDLVFFDFENRPRVLRLGGGAVEGASSL